MAALGSEPVYCLGGRMKRMTVVAIVGVVMMILGFTSLASAAPPGTPWYKSVTPDYTEDGDSQEYSVQYTPIDGTTWHASTSTSVSLIGGNPADGNWEQAWSNFTNNGSIYSPSFVSEYDARYSDVTYSQSGVSTPPLYGLYWKWEFTGYGNPYYRYFWSVTFTGSVVGIAL